MEDFTAPDVIMKEARVGDIITLDGRRWRVTKKTNFNIALEEYEWYNKILDWIVGRNND